MTDADRKPPFSFTDRYEAVAELGRGGFAIVYRARDHQLQRDVAVKLLRADSIPRGASDRFEREMSVTARLEHRNILHVYDTGIHDGAPFFVMELVRGSTLESRLAVEGALPVSDALSITDDVARALEFAHENRVVHRDVKPANILLGAGGALLGDFGIAHVLGGDAVARITSTGIAVGTMQYMSPEQLCADPAVDARSDQYSLALVCYEMLTGVAAHHAKSFEALRALRLAGTLVSIRAHRVAVPEYVDVAIARALSPAPADRFRDMREFSLALAGLSTGERSAVTRTSDSAARAARAAEARAPTDAGTGRPSRRAGLMAAGATLLAATAFGIYLTNDPSREIDGLDNGAPVVVLEPGEPRDSVERRALEEELASWREVRVQRAEGRTRASGSMIVMRPSSRTVGDSVHWNVEVENVTQSRVLRLTQRAGDPVNPSALRALVVRALFGAAADSAPSISELAEPSLTAGREYADGWRQLRAGNLDSARTRFASAAVAAPSFAHAHLWVAQTTAWSAPKLAAGWRDAARRALMSPTLRGVDSLLAVALASLAEGSPPAACDAYRAAIARDADSFAAWFGLGECQRIDSIVVRDARVAGGVRFRSSHWSAVAAYSDALSRLPTPALSILFQRAIPVTYASSSQTRIGIALPPDSARYFAFPSVAGDSIETIPLPSAAVTRMALGTLPESFSRATDLGRERLLGFTRRWVEYAPTSAHAWLHRAYALELSGTFAAPDDINSAARALTRADSLTADFDLRARVDVARVRIAVREGFFDEAMRLARVALARRDDVSAQSALLLAPLAAFIGAADRAATLLRIAATSDATRGRLPQWAAASVTPWLADSLRSFGARAAIGVCGGLAERRDALEAGLLQQVAAADLAALRVRLLPDVYRMAAPCLGPSVLHGFSPRIPFDEALSALAAGDRARARRILETLSMTRRGTAISTVAQDALLAESWALLQTGDSVGARARIKANQAALGRMSPFTLDEVAQAAALPRLRRMSQTQ